MDILILVASAPVIVLLVGVLEMSLSEPGVKRTLPRILRAFARNWKQAPMLDKISLVVSLAVLLMTFIADRS